MSAARPTTSRSSGVVTDRASTWAWLDSSSSGDVAVSWYDTRNDLGTGGSGDTDGIRNDVRQAIRQGFVATTVLGIGLSRSERERALEVAVVEAAGKILIGRRLAVAPPRTISNTRSAPACPRRPSPARWPTPTSTST